MITIIIINCVMIKDCCTCLRDIDKYNALSEIISKDIIIKYE